MYVFTVEGEHLQFFITCARESAESGPFIRLSVSAPGNERRSSRPPC